MSEFVQAVDMIAVREASRVAFKNSRSEYITYGQLKTYSDNLAVWLGECDGKRDPVVVYGHKSPYMPVGFLACAKSGRAYVPLDSSVPPARLIDILRQLESPIFISTVDPVPQELLPHVSRVLCRTDLMEVVVQPPPSARVSAEMQVQGDDTFYIIFTSGSTGTPKGVEIDAANFDAFWKWMLAEFAGGEKRVYFNRAPFSFDLSVTDLALGLGCGDTLFALEAEDEVDLKRSFDALARNDIDFWISTASFADMCLADPSFSHGLLPNLRTFFFVGETLKNSTAKALMERFPGVAVINGYGPTESTDLVSSVRITPEMADDVLPLPVGIARPGTILKILDPVSLCEVPSGTEGELYILGDTVGKGYYRRDDLTRAAFHACPDGVAQGRRSYKTGDAAYLDEQGMLHFRGRLDLQIKMHGYRIELGDIESNLCRLDSVRDACVLPVSRNGSVSHLAAYVVLEEGMDSGLERTRKLKSALKEALPEYMVPRKFVYGKAFPLTGNGKIDRVKLQTDGFDG